VLNSRSRPTTGRSSADSDAFVDNPKGYDLFAVPALDVSDEILSRVAAKLVAAFADAKLADDDKAIDALLAATDNEVSEILKREGLLGK